MERKTGKARMNFFECRQVTKRFGALEALRKFSFTLGKGEILGLIGPNGSGKTTFFNVVAGIYAPDEGEVYFHGRPISGLSPHEICQRGIAKTSQMTQPFREITVFENLLIPTLYGRRVGLKKARGEADSILHFVGLEDVKNYPSADLPPARRRQLELGRVLATGAELLLIDEVMAGLNPTEVEEALKLLQRIVAGGKTIILVEHVMQAIMKISGRIVVLNYGEKIAEGKPHEVTTNPDVIQAYLGRPYA
jgi:branched-chain amino acid transport system ATP-binding protein